MANCDGNRHMYSNFISCALEKNLAVEWNIDMILISYIIKKYYHFISKLVCKFSNCKFKFDKFEYFSVVMWVYMDYNGENNVFLFKV